MYKSPSATATVGHQGRCNCNSWFFVQRGPPQSTFAPGIPGDLVRLQGRLWASPVQHLGWSPHERVRESTPTFFRFFERAEQQFPHTNFLTQILGTAVPGTAVPGTAVYPIYLFFPKIFLLPIFPDRTNPVHLNLFYLPLLINKLREIILHL